MKQYADRVIAWSCVAHCADQSRRMVTGFYQEERCFLISRAWVTPLHKPLLLIGHPVLCPALEVLISLADFQVVEGVWTGSTPINGNVLACLTGVSQNSGYTHLAALARAGFIHYEPGGRRIAQTLIRIFPSNYLTGIPLVQPTSEWGLSFITKLDRVAMLREMAAPRMGWEVLLP